MTRADQKVAKCWTSASSHLHSDLDLHTTPWAGNTDEHLGVTSAMLEKLFLEHRGIDCSRKRRAFVIRLTGQP